MNESVSLPDFNSSVVTQARKDFPLLDARMSVAEALERIRREGVGERVIYFFAIDEQERLVGVLPTRRLLTASLETRLEEIMVRRVIAIPASATILEACEFFVLYKFFAFPVVDKERRVIGVVDVSLFAEELLEARESDQQSSSTPLPSDDVFEALEMQNDIQKLYTGGTVFHGFIGEAIDDAETCKKLVRKIAETYEIPYFTITPTFSVCQIHGYLKGEQPSCPNCGEETEIYSRIVGYYRPVKNWNVGKKSEYKERKIYKVNIDKEPQNEKAARNAECVSALSSAEDTLCKVT
jgi:CBS domain-containing protein